MMSFFLLPLELQFLNCNIFEAAPPSDRIDDILIVVCEKDHLYPLRWSNLLCGH